MSNVATAGPESNWETLERQDWHLWILAVLLMFVLGISLLSFMFPSVFRPGQQAEIGTPERAFFGFCVLLALTLVYMMQRQATVRRLRRSLFQAQAATTEAEQQIHVVSLTSLPEKAQFRDALAMDYRRASHSGETLSVLLLNVGTPNLGTEDMGAVKEEELGRIAHLLRQLLRPHETLFRVSPQRFGLILPSMRSVDVEAFANQLTDRVRRAMPRETISSTVIAYPEQASTLTELEGCLRVLVGDIKN